MIFGLHPYFFVFFFALFKLDSEVSFSLLSGNGGHNGTRHSGLNSLNNTRLIISPGSKPVKIAAISGKPRVQRYLSRECEFYVFLLFRMP